MTPPVFGWTEDGRADYLDGIRAHIVKSGWDSLYFYLTEYGWMVEPVYPEAYCSPQRADTWFPRQYAGTWAYTRQAPAAKRSAA